MWFPHGATAERRCKGEEARVKRGRTSEKKFMKEGHAGVAGNQRQIAIDRSISSDIRPPLLRPSCPGILVRLLVTMRLKLTD